MRRHARPVPLARMRLENLSRRLELEPNEWPSAHLRRAWKILRSRTGLTEQTTRHVMVKSVSAAHTCAIAIDRRSRDNVELKTRVKVGHAFERLANSSARASATLRQALDRALAPIVGSERIDL